MLRTRGAKKRGKHVSRKEKMQDISEKVDEDAKQCSRIRKFQRVLDREHGIRWPGRHARCTQRITSTKHNARTPIRRSGAAGTESEMTQDNYSSNSQAKTHKK